MIPHVDTVKLPEWFIDNIGGVSLSDFVLDVGQNITILSRLQHTKHLDEQNQCQKCLVQPNYF